MTTCVLRASGEAFDVDSFLAITELAVYRTWRLGETGRPRKQPNSDSGICVLVSEAEGDLSAQALDAVAFLAANVEELRRLASFTGVEGVSLDFGYLIRKVAMQCDYLPPELLARAGNLGIGIELSLYPELGSG
jgi:hypothetical protein